MRAIVLAALLILPACSSPAEETPAQASQTPDGYQQAAAALDAAISGKDQAALEQLIADDFLWVRGSGAMGDKAAFIGALTSDSLDIEPFTAAGARWIVEGNSALLAATNTLKGTADGEEFVDRHRFGDHWLWRDGEWRLVYAQITPVQDGESPG